MGLSHCWRDYVPGSLGAWNWRLVRRLVITSPCEIVGKLIAAGALSESLHARHEYAVTAPINLITNKGNEMENKVLDEIVKYAAKQLNNAYGFCGVASSPNSAFLNSSDLEGNDIFIKIEVKQE